jgi:hypothetical protein
VRDCQSAKNQYDPGNQQTCAPAGNQNIPLTGRGRVQNVQATDASQIDQILPAVEMMKIFVQNLDGLRPTCFQIPESMV